MKEEPPLEQKCKDKFLVQSVAVADADLDQSNVTAVVCGLSKNRDRRCELNMRNKTVRESFQGLDQRAQDPRELAAS